MTYSFFGSAFTVTGNNNTMHSKNRIGNRNFHFKLPIVVFQIYSISLIKSEDFRETLINVISFIDQRWKLFLL